MASRPGNNHIRVPEDCLLGSRHALMTLTKGAGTCAPQVHRNAFTSLTDPRNSTWKCL